MTTITFLFVNSLGTVDQNVYQNITLSIRHNMLIYKQILNTTKRNVLIKLSRFITIVNNYCKS